MRHETQRFECKNVKIGSITDAIPQISNEIDFVKHVECIHYNPVKHELTKAPIAWLYYSFHRIVKQGGYNRDCGAGTGIVCGEKRGAGTTCIVGFRFTQRNLRGLT